MPARQVVEQLVARSASDGDGVNLLRVFGGGRHGETQPERFDPFLLMDEFGSNRADDYIGGFPPHPHRGFATLTYMLQGKMEHRDHMGNVGLLSDGGVQWMVAGRGVIHSEMPQQTSGKMRGFQLWLNLPASKKMQPAAYEDVAPNNIPNYELPSAEIKAIAGKAQLAGQTIEGYLSIEDTHVLLLDVMLKPHEKVSIPVAPDHNALVYVYEGKATLGATAVMAKERTLSRFDQQGDVLLENPSSQSSRLMLLAGRPINEPVVQHGPFVMNTEAEIRQAMQDYQAGTLVDGGREYRLVSKEGRKNQRI